MGEITLKIIEGDHSTMLPMIDHICNLSPVYSDTTQLNSTASCRSADGASAALNFVTQLK